MRRAVYAGSFDPPTLGHLWVIDQGRALFDELIVAIGINADKRYHFPLADRLDMLREITAGFANVRVASYENLFLVRYAERAGAQFILRGIRHEQDYGYEKGMRYVNAELDSGIRTVFVIPPRELVEVSSSFVKGLVGPDGWEHVLAKYVPPAVHRRFLERSGHAPEPRTPTVYPRPGGRAPGEPAGERGPVDSAPPYPLPQSAQRPLTPRQ